MLGLPYPGGPELEALARQGDPQRFDFPRPMIGRPEADFSFSGLKTAARQALLRLGDSPRESDRRDLAASFQAAVVDVVIDRLRVALRILSKNQERPQGLAMGGGVCANGALRQALAHLCGEAGLRLATPPPELCADNAAMIAFAGLERFKIGLANDLAFAPRPRWPLDAVNRPDSPARASTVP